MNKDNIIKIFEVYNKNGEKFEQQTLYNFLSLSEKILLDVVNSEIDLLPEYKWINNNFQEILLKITINLNDSLFINILDTTNIELEVINEYEINDKEKYISYINLLCSLDDKINFISKINEDKNIEQITDEYEEVAA